MRAFISYTTVVVTLIFLQVSSLDMESAKESSCFRVKTVPVDAHWTLSTRLWYYPLMTLYDLYHLGLEISGKDPRDLREDEVYYNLCMTSWFIKDKFFVKGFEQTKRFFVHPTRGLEEFTWGADNIDNKKTPYVAYVTLTDNKTFILFAACMGGQMSWGVSSTRKRLPEATTKLIYDHAEAIGFKREYFTALQYDSCQKGFEGIGNRETKND